MFLAGFIYSLVSLGLSYLFFKEIPKAASMLMVFLIVLAVLPVVYVTIKKEEELELKHKEMRLLKEHTKVLVFLMFLFLGILAALTMAYIFLPTEIVDVVFKVQQQETSGISSKILGQATKFDFFAKILINNLRVVFFCLVFSLLYGSGAIFILSWNCSVVAMATGDFFKANLAKFASLLSPSAAAYFGAASFSFFRYMTHGIFETMGYFAAGLAGGIISVAIIKGEGSKNKIILDVLVLVLISLLLTATAAYVEVYVTPVLMMKGG